MVHHTLQNKDRWRIIDMWETGQTQTVIARQIGINQSQVSRLIAKYRQTNDVTDRPQPWRPRISSAANDRVLVLSALPDPKAHCSELCQQWQNLNVQASTTTVKKRLNKAGLKACRPRRQTFLMLDHRCNRVQWAANKLHWNLRTWCRIYWSDESRLVLCYMDGRVCASRRRGQVPFQDNVVAKTKMFGGGSIMVWGCFSHDHKLDFKVVRQTLTGQHYIDDILEPIVYPHFLAHQAEHPIFQDANACPHRACVATDSLEKRGLRIFTGRAGAPIWIPSNTFGTAWDVTSANEMRLLRLMTLYMHLSKSGTIWSPSFLEN